VKRRVASPETLRQPAVQLVEPGALFRGQFITDGGNGFFSNLFHSRKKVLPQRSHLGLRFGHRCPDRFLLLRGQIQIPGEFLHDPALSKFRGALVKDVLDAGFEIQSRTQGARAHSQEEQQGDAAE
jgi:hypothetical protein